MSKVVIYVLQVMLVSGVLSAYYYFFLRNRQFHHYNRYFLLGTVILSLLVPFLDIPVYFDSPQAIYQVMAEVKLGGSTGISESGHSFSINSTLFYCYLIIGGLLLVRVLGGLVRLLRLFAISQVSRIDNISLIHTTAKGTPYSFFRWLFWNDELPLRSSKGQQIFRHELYHIHQGHSWDIMLLEFVCVVMWFNPFFYLIRKELRAIHEFLADRYAASDEEKWEYAELLLMEAFQTRQRLVNPFFHTQIKRRIAMITSSKRTGPQYFRKMMVLPILFATIAGVAIQCRQKDNIAQKPVEELQLEAVTVDSTQFKAEPVTPMKEITLSDLNDNKIFEKVEVEASFSGGVDAWREFLNKNLNAVTPVDHGAPTGKYTVFVQFVVDKDGTISNLKALTNHGYGMEKEVIRVMKMSPRWKSAIQNGQPVRAYRKQPVTFSVTEV